MGSGPDADEAQRRYRGIAAGYEGHARLVGPIRRKAVARLKLQPGEHVLDMGCGTGASFGDLRSEVGAAGRVTGVDLSDDMATVARQRIAAKGWNNVDVLVGDANEVELPSPVDGVLFFETHDLLRSPTVVRRALAAARLGARVVAFGPATTTRWNLPVNALVRRVAARYITTLDGLDAPWTHLAAELGDLRVHRLFLGGAYLAIGVVPER